MKLADWAKREDLQQEWKMAWENNSALKQGLELLKDIALPAEVRTPENVDLVQFNALANARREGYYDCIRNIEALKQISVKQPDLPDPWEDTKKES